MKENVIIRILRITQKEQQCAFQVKLPTDAKRIIGVETGLLITSAVPAYLLNRPLPVNYFSPNELLGTMQLWIPGQANFCYATEIKERDKNILIGELQNPLWNEKEPLPTDGNGFYDYTAWTHGQKREEDSIHVCGCTFLNGHYSDQSAKNDIRVLQYQVKLYIWYETI